MEVKYDLNKYQMHTEKHWERESARGQASSTSPFSLSLQWTLLIFCLFICKLFLPEPSVNNLIFVSDLYSRAKPVHVFVAQHEIFDMLAEHHYLKKKNRTTWLSIKHK